MTKPTSRKPKSFKLDTKASDKQAAPKRGSSKTAGESRQRRPRAIEPPYDLQYLPPEAVDEAYRRADEMTPPPPPPPIKKGFGWGKLMLSAFSALAMLAIGVALDQFIHDLFARNNWLGWAAIALTTIAVLATLGLVGREMLAMFRLSTLEGLKDRGETAKAENNLKNARSITIEIGSLFASRPETAHSRSELEAHGQDVMRAKDLLFLVERDLLAPLDKKARTMVMQSARRVSIVTAVSPRALIDIAYVLMENTRLIRKIAEHYGGRPGFFSSMKLIRQVLTHLAATGAIAVGEGLMQQIVGHGIAARVSTRLGEGVINGLLTARIGIAAIDVCRPLQFDAERRPGVNDFLSALTISEKKAHNEKK